MTVVYLIGAGEYSDYRIAKAFLDGDKAREFVRVHNENRGYGDEYVLEEHVVSDDEITVTPTDLVAQYEVRLWPNHANDAWWTDKMVEHHAPHYVAVPPGITRATSHWVVCAKDSEHAKKIAQDAEAKRKAEELGL